MTPVELRQGYICVTCGGPVVLWTTRCGWVRTVSHCDPHHTLSHPPAAMQPEDAPW